jgi:pimeloyl-ACP methyl ester carboxylesterase
MSAANDYRSCFATVLGRELHYTEWGAAGNPRVLVMWHGLLRSGRDFDDAAAAFAATHRVVCPDTIGRGCSEWSPSPAAEYNVPFYAALAAALLDQLGVAEVEWLGTSMGGQIGMAAAGTVLRGRVTKLLLNDIGPRLSQPALDRIKAYSGKAVEFARLSEYEAYLKGVYAALGPQDPEWFRRMIKHQARRLPNGSFGPSYDPALAAGFDAIVADSAAAWAAFDAMTCDVLVVRGGESTLLLPDGVAAMVERPAPPGRRPIQHVTVPGVGHAPAFNIPSQIDIALAFFNGA